MEDLELQLLTLLENNWSLSLKPLFHRNMRRVEGSLTQANVIVCESQDMNVWDKESMAECLALIIIRTRIPSAGTTNEEVENAKQDKQEIREEIYNVLKKMNTAEIEKPDGWEWAHITRRSNGDNFDAPTPLLGEDLNITIAYQRTEEAE